MLEKKLEASFQKNRLAMSLWDGLWAIGMPLCMYATVVPLYLLELHVSKTLMQIVVVGFSVITVAQFFTGPLMKSPNRKFWIFLTWIIFSLAWLLYGSLALLFWEKFPLEFWIVFFVLICAILSFARHYGTPSLRGLVIENIPMRKRGSLASFRSLLLGLGGILGSFLASFLMKGDSSLSHFHFLFFIGSLIFIVACLPFLFLFKDHAVHYDSLEKRSLSLFESAKKIFKEKNMRRFLYMYAVLFMAQNMAPLLLSYSKDVLFFSHSSASNFNLVYFVSALLIGTTIPPLADRFGFKLMALVSSFILIISYLIPLLPWSGKDLIYLSYFFYAGSYILSQLLLGNFGAEIFPNVSPTTIIVISSTFVMPVALVMAPLSGSFVDHFGKSGYPVIFILGSVLSFISLIGFSFFVKEPRK